MAYVDQVLIKIAIYKGYCTLYSNYYIIEQAKQQVADELLGESRKNERIMSNNPLNSKKRK